MAGIFDVEIDLMILISKSNKTLSTPKMKTSRQFHVYSASSTVGPNFHNL